MLHGDAAFAGQGVVAETLNLANLPGYRVGGTIHIIVNNQIGFTTAPEYSRSSEYCTDVAKMIGAPIFHVNGDDPEACVWVARLAVDFRQKFKKDVVIDMLCYRRRGHNEGDDPSMTNPYMYDVVDTKRGVRKSYTEALIGRGDISMKEAEDALRDYQGQLERVFNEVRDLEKHGAQPSESVESDQLVPAGLTTAVDKSLLARIGDAFLAVPEGFTVHPRVQPVLEKRREMAYEGKIDWAFGELLALGSLVAEGKLIRLSGQDTRRGTFSQRHSVIIDRNTGEEFTPLQLLATNEDGTPTGGKFLVYDSPLSEYAAVGFEYGYTVGNPDAMVLWEAQFGDFVNGAQSIIDEFISSGEAKWGQLSNVVLLLPHGHEGQGPDHTSGRIERFLQLWAEGSMTMAVPSTPSNYFHLLRRHALDGIQRPLIVFTPKSMLRNKAAVSDIKDFTEIKFRSVLEEPTYEDGIGDREQGHADPADQRQDLLRAGGAQGQGQPRRRRDRADRAARPAAEAPAGRDAGPLPERQGVLLGAGGAGQPGRLAALRPGAAGVAARQVDRAQADLAPGDVGAVVGLVEGARRRAAGDPRQGVRLSLSANGTSPSSGPSRGNRGATATEIACGRSSRGQPRWLAGVLPTLRHARGDLSNRATAIDVLHEGQLSCVEIHAPIRPENLIAGQTATHAEHRNIIETSRPSKNQWCSSLSAGPDGTP